MTIFNVDGAALFGPGSEWLWTMLQFLALAVTGIAIFRQLRAQAYANQFNVITRMSDYFDSDQFTRYKLTVLIEIVEGATTISPAMSRLGGFFDNVASGRHTGHIKPFFAWDEWSDVAQTYWAILAPLARDARATQPGLWREWEEWMPELIERDRKAARPTNVSPEYIAWWIPDSIAYYIERLRIEQETRTGVVPTWTPASPVAKPASPVAEPSAPLAS